VTDPTSDDDLPEVLRGLSDEEVTDAFVVVGHELHRKSRRRRLLESLLSITMIVVIFAFVIPRLTGSEYHEVWDRITTLNGREIVLLVTLWAAGMLVYTSVLTNTLPGLRHRQALVVNFAGSAVSNVMPFGGALGVGATYAIDMSWGFTPPAVTISILVSGVWNVFAKLGMPVLALVMLTLTGEPSGTLVIPTLLGLVVLIGAVVVLTMILRSEQLAVTIGGIGQRPVDRVWSILRRPSTPDVLRAVLDFRHESIGLVRRRWLRLTLWIVIYNGMQYLLLLTCVRLLHMNDVGWAEVFAAFAFARLLETIPLTPSGVGFVEAGTASALIAFGGDEASATAAVFLFRGFV
jgi:putative heme transporter